MHFINQSLMPTSHTATTSLNRLQLLHSILNGRSVDVGKIIVDEAYACLKRKSSPLLFPHLITALCRKKGVFESPEDLQKKGRLGITIENILSLMGFDETAPAKQPLGGARTVAAAKLAALTTMAESTRDQLEKLSTDLRTYFNYVQERDQVIKANFNEMLPQSSLNFPEFPQDLLKETETKTPEKEPAQPAAEHTTDQPQDKPLGTDSASSSPTPPDATPQHQSPPTQRRKGKEPETAPVASTLEVDSEETVALEEEEPQRTPTPPVATTPRGGGAIWCRRKRSTHNHTTNPPNEHQTKGHQASQEGHHQVDQSRDDSAEPLGGEMFAPYSSRVGKGSSDELTPFVAVKKKERRKRNFSMKARRNLGLWWLIYQILLEKGGWWLILCAGKVKVLKAE
ncbi:hypothetical protein GQ457_16G014410 [Hibiscus cannabinus]